jgi:hypothetical protein
MKMYRWCCCFPYLELTKGSRSEVDLKYGSRDIPESCSIFCCSKDNRVGG